MDIALLVLAAFFLILLVYFIVQYNGLIALRNHIAESWSDIDTELKRRYDLIPNLVQTVKGYATHESSVLDRVTQLRNQCSGNQGTAGQQSGDEQLLVGALQNLFVIVENYPDLKADENFLQLQEELIITENRIQAARRFYNGNIRDYRNKRESFPSNIVASSFGFGPAEFFEVEPSVREVPNSKF